MERADAEFIIICTNTIHKLADDVQKNVSIPILHIVDAVADKIVEKGFSKVGLLGTKFTMEEDFYKKRLKEKYDIEVIIPEKEERETIHNIIYNELCLGKITGTSKDKFLKIIKNLNTNGAEGVILGCTEIPLLIKAGDVEIPIFDTTTIHAKASVEFAL